MEIYDELPDLKMTALAVLYKTKWRSRVVNKSNDFVVKESLAAFASSLQDDDVGYFYDPNSPMKLCTDPGELVGKIANSRLEYGYNLYKAVDCLSLVLRSLDKIDYNRIGIIVSDCFDKQEVERAMSVLSDLKVYVFGIGNKCQLADGVIYLEDAYDLSAALKEMVIF